MNKNSSQLNTLTALSPIDGRYWETTKELSKYFSEYALIKKRFEVEIKYLIFLSKKGIAPKLSESDEKILNYYIKKFDAKDAKRVKEIEKEVNHDVKAVEYFIREVLKEIKREELIPYAHLFLTSNDINATSYRLLVKSALKEQILPEIKKVTSELKKLSEKYSDSVILGRTHGQAAVPTTFGKEMSVFLKRINGQLDELKSIELKTKLSGSVGNWNAQRVVNSRKDWVELSKDFVSSLDLKLETLTTQTAPPEDLIEIFHYISRINAIIRDLDKDMWRYISDGWITRKAKKSEVGSSTMPQKVNPINFENSEGNIEIANSLFEMLARELPVSRLQRDLTDSTLMRNLGVALSHSILAYKNTVKGLKTSKLNKSKVKNELENDWSILTEAAQTILRNSGEESAYEIIKEKISGKKIDNKGWKKLVKSLNLKKTDEKKLLNLTPEGYIGYAKKIARKEI